MKKFMLIVLLTMGSAIAQTTAAPSATSNVTIPAPAPKQWFEKIGFKGYTHIRYNRMNQTNKNLNCAQCDNAWGDKKGIGLRRARFTFLGDVTDHVYIYIQTDFSQNSINNMPDGTQSTFGNYLNIRDAYFDYSIGEDKTFRVRSGVTKVPYSNDILQSSSNRSAFDRTDAMNSGQFNERDMGVFFLYTPPKILENLQALVKNNLKGSGDYGMVEVGAYNGQTLNRPEMNNDLHRAARVTYPWKTASGQFMEASLSGYEGKYVFYTPSNLVAGALPAGAKPQFPEFYEQRTAASFIYYPQPFGVRGEYTVGSGPEFDPDKGRVTKQKLKGGWIQIEHMIYCGDTRYQPYVRYQYYDGGKKQENGRAYNVNEVEVGTEWQPDPAFELTVAYAKSDRTTSDANAINNHQNGSLVRVQAQFNY